MHCIQWFLHSLFYARALELQRISRFYLKEEFFQQFICLSNPKPQKKFVRTLWSEFSVSDNMHKFRLLCNNVHAIYSTESLALHSLQDHVYYYSHVVTSIILAQYLQKEDFFHVLFFAGLNLLCSFFCNLIAIRSDYCTHWNLKKRGNRITTNHRFELVHESLKLLRG